MERVFYADFLRVFASFAVILLHVAAGMFVSLPIQSQNWEAANFYDSITRWCVPVFIMLSGAFMLDFRRYSQNISENFIKISKKQLIRAMIALLFWSAFYALLLNYKEPNKAFSYFLDFPFTPLIYHLWFLYLIVGLYLLTPFLQILVRGLDKKGFEILLFVLTIFGSGIFLINKILEQINHPKIFFPETAYFGFLLYFLAGFYFRIYEISKKFKISLYVLAILCLILTFTLTSHFSTIANERITALYVYQNLNTAVVAFAVFIFFKNLFSNFKDDGNFANVIKFLSKISFGIYLIHPAFLYLFSLNKFRADFTSTWIGIPLFAILLFVLSAFTSYIMSKLPILKKMI